eukprot:m.241735 g.241735  ORF g.241735 m.241735 type:complete len:565 (-) comp24732_c0_seq1:20-1714(-)
MRKAALLGGLLAAGCATFFILRSKRLPRVLREMRYAVVSAFQGDGGSAFSPKRQVEELLDSIRDSDELPPPPFQQIPELPGLVRARLPNGVRIRSVRNAFPADLYYIALQFQCGMLDETESQWGHAALTAHALRAALLETDLSALGVTLLPSSTDSLETTKFAFVVQAGTEPDAIPAILAQTLTQLRDILFHAPFTTEVLNATHIAMGSLQSIEHRQAWEQLVLLCPKKPLAHRWMHPTTLSEEAIAEAVTVFRAQHYTASRLTVAAVGDVSASVVKDLLAEVFKVLPASSVPPRPTPSPLPFAVLHGPDTNVTLLIAAFFDLPAVPTVSSLRLALLARVVSVIFDNRVATCKPAFPGHAQLLFPTVTLTSPPGQQCTLRLVCPLSTLQQSLIAGIRAVDALLRAPLSARETREACVAVGAELFTPLPPAPLAGHSRGGDVDLKGGHKSGPESNASAGESLGAGPVLLPPDELLASGEVLTHLLHDPPRPEPGAATLALAWLLLARIQPDDVRDFALRWLRPLTGARATRDRSSVLLLLPSGTQQSPEAIQRLVTDTLAQSARK